MRALVWPERNDRLWSKAGIRIGHSPSILAEKRSNKRAEWNSQINASLGSGFVSRGLSFPVFSFNPVPLPCQDSGSDRPSDKTAKSPPNSFGGLSLSYIVKGDTLRVPCGPGRSQRPVRTGHSPSSQYCDKRSPGQRCRMLTYPWWRHIWPAHRPAPWRSR